MQVNGPGWPPRTRDESFAHAVPVPADVVRGCCTISFGNPSCTPWGPPAPPAMGADDDLGWLDEAMGAAA